MNICIYGASSDSIDAAYLEAAYTLGRQMAARGHGLVYGGGARGMMGAAARGVHDGGGWQLGVAPTFFQVDGVLYEHCNEFVYTETMRERKQVMEERSDAFVMTAGGVGTFEEVFEILTLKQLGRHAKPIAVLNTGGYYNALQTMLEQAIEQRFMKPECRRLYRFCNTPEEVLEYLETAADDPVYPTAMKHLWLHPETK